MKTKMNRHTPGPWQAVKGSEKKEFYIEECGERAIVATAHVCCGWEKANARLIAAAPEMLDTCKWVLSCLGNMPYSDDVHSAKRELIAIIAKAEGGK